MTTTITIAGLPLVGTVADTAIFATENLGVTQGFTALSLKTYMTTMPNLTVSGTLSATGSITGTLATASQPNITALGTLLGVSTSGQIVSTVATGTAPLSVQSTSLVANLYVARAASADSAVGGITVSTPLTTASGSDMLITGNIGNIRSVLNTVNSYPGVWGGVAGGIYQIPTVTVNAKGLVTFGANTALDLTASAVTQLVGTANQITVSGSVGTSQISLPTQVNLTNLSASATITAANVASSSVFDSGNRVLTSFTVTAGTGMSGGGFVTASNNYFTLTNTGVVSLISGTGISVTGNTGTVTINNTGVTAVSAGSGIAVSGATGGVTISASRTSNGYGTRYISSGTPSGGSDGDVWYRI